MLSGMHASSRAELRIPEPWLGLLLVAAVFAAYWPALSGGLVWDDDAHITVAALQGWDGLRRIWFEPGVTQQYYPVLHSAFWLEHRLWGDLTAGYHALNALLHAISACLVVVMCQRLQIRGAWIGGLLFALHPVNVESVAWISEQKNTLSLVFALSATLAWLRFDETRAVRDWGVAFALFALALGTKSVTATLPCVLLVVVWWRRGAISWSRDVQPLLPWLALGVAAGVATAWVERHVIGAEGAEFTLSPAQRLLVAARALTHYLATYTALTRRMFTYPRWTLDVRSLVAWLYLMAMIALTAALWMLRRRTRAPWAAWLAFTGMLFPVLGFLNVYPFRYAFVADHFQYHASIPLAVLAAAGVAWLHERATARAVQLGTGIVLLALGALTFRQAGDYRDAETLYRATLASNPASWMAHHNLGRLVSRKPGGLEEAITQFEAAIALKPDHARAHYALGVALQRVGRAAEAVPHFEAAIRYEPNNGPLVANAHYILGDLLRRNPQRIDDAIAHLREAIRRKPTVAEAHNTLGETLMSVGRVDEARAEFADARRLQPGYEAAQRNLAGLARTPAQPKGASTSKRP